ncbi:hypothetical protein QBC39DRAFT_22198 [Podospora conica]|nr:hypothetical protein QBC39DRAFT_22198 [Schizothecium conicum]
MQHWTACPVHLSTQVQHRPSSMHWQFGIIIASRILLATRVMSEGAGLLRGCRSDDASNSAIWPAPFRHGRRVTSPRSTPTAPTATSLGAFKHFRRRQRPAIPARVPRSDKKITQARSIGIICTVTTLSTFGLGASDSISTRLPRRPARARSEAHSTTTLSTTDSTQRGHASTAGASVMADSGGERSRSITLVVGQSALMAVNQPRWHATEHTYKQEGKDLGAQQGHGTARPWQDSSRSASSAPSSRSSSDGRCHRSVTPPRHPQPAACSVHNQTLAPPSPFRQSSPPWPPSLRRRRRRHRSVAAIAPSLPRLRLAPRLAADTSLARSTTRRSRRHLLVCWRQLRATAAVGIFLSSVRHRVARPSPATPTTAPSIPTLPLALRASRRRVSVVLASLASARRVSSPRRRASKSGISISSDNSAINSTRRLL